MLDRKYILEHIEDVKLNCKNRNMRADVDLFVAKETARRDAQRRLEEMNKEANNTAKMVGKCATPEERKAMIEKGRVIREQIADLSSTVKEMDNEIDALQKTIPNMAHPDAPIGDDDTSNAPIAYGKTPKPEFDFTPLDHVELAKQLDLIDFEGGARVAGAGFYFLKNEAALLELALQLYAVQFLRQRGFTPVTTPDLARNDILQGTGYIPRGNETQIYSVENSDLSLIATAEITLGGLLAGRTIDASQLPIRLCGTSHCFRTEAGAAGRASRGLYRVHQFTKIEMFAFTLPEQSDAIHQELLSMERQLFDNLGIAYRVVDTATGDLGGPAYRKFDIEAWMPGRGDYGEVTSTSNCTDYQARRLGARFKVKDEKGTRFLHTLNGTAIAISRALLSIMENYQTKEGEIIIPEVLRPYVGMDKIERKSVSPIL